MKIKKYKRIIISRTDSIGDVVLTLPVAGALKKHIPGCEIIFLGNSYTSPVIKASSNIDEFADWHEMKRLSPGNRIKKMRELRADAIIHVYPRIEISRLAFKAGIPLRIGTTRRPYHFLYCNKLVQVSRKRSDLHESCLNLKLLSGLNIPSGYELSEIPDLYGIQKQILLNQDILNLIDHERINIILHPKSKGSAREWDLDNFLGFIRLADPSKYKIFISGTNEDSTLMSGFIKDAGCMVTDLSGKMNLTEFIGFIGQCDCIVAASTGPLHIASALGIYALGLYAPMKPIYPVRWSPVGKNSDFLVKDRENCNDCRKTMNCNCIRSIAPSDVLQKIEMHFTINPKHNGK